MDIVTIPVLQDDLRRATVFPGSCIREDPATYASSSDDGDAPVSQALSHGEELRLTREIMTGLAQRRRWRADLAPAQAVAGGDEPTAAALDSSADPAIDLLLAFDRREGWRDTGAASTVAWMNAQLGIGRSTGDERLQVARESEALAALHLSVSGVEGLCERYRHPRSLDESADNAATLRERAARSDLPAEAAGLVAAVERAAALAREVQPFRLVAPAVLEESAGADRPTAA